MSNAEEKDKRPERQEDRPTASFDGLLKRPGSQIGPFQIEQEIGRGAVGVVYLAKDTRLDRKVAVKTMPDELMGNPLVRKRWKREAQILASLNHPNIAMILEVFEESEGFGCLILEYVAGQTLSERITKGPVKIEEALSIALQIAEAVSAAHEHGVIHRDLKPGNIKITPEGNVKVLDFGLAKSVGGETRDLQTTVTEPGRIIGTPAYMSPEQARGNPIDERSDIWSFGCILYEMLNGTIPFEGQTFSDTIANILGRDPDWKALPKSTPANIQVLIRRCLEKDPHRRLQNIGDAAIEISETINLPATAPPVTSVPAYTPRPKRFISSVIWSIAGLMFLFGAVTLWTSLHRKPSSLSHVASFTVGLPQNQELMEAIVSPDGERLVYSLVVGVNYQFFVREIGQTESKELPGTTEAYFPFFSPDGQWIGFFQRGQLKKLFLNGGKPIRLCDVVGNWGMGGCWSDDDTIYFSRDANGGIWKISANGGKPQQVTMPDREKGEIGHWFPQVLPGSRDLLFTIWDNTLNDYRIAVLSHKTGMRQTLITSGAEARYTPTGHLLYTQAGTLMAAPFDIRNLKVGEPRPVLKGLTQYADLGTSSFSFSKDGLFCYVHSGGSQLQLVWVNRQGKVEPLALPEGAYNDLRLSPNGQYLVFSKLEGDSENIWVHKFSSGTTTQLTFKKRNFSSVWTPDSARLTFTTFRAGMWEIYWMPADGSSTEKPLLTGLTDKIASSWSPDGKVFLFGEINIETGCDVSTVCTDDTNMIRPFLHESYNEYDALFSPDGHWVAYVTDAEGREEVYVTRYPGPGEKYKISTDGGSMPVWSPDGRELFYCNREKMMAVAVDTNSSRFEIVKPPEILFEGLNLAKTAFRNYDITPDGQRFVMIRNSEGQPTTNQLIVVLNWFEELKRLVPTGKTK